MSVSRPMLTRRDASRISARPPGPLALPRLRCGTVVLALSLLASLRVDAQVVDDLPSPLRLEHVLEFGRTHRAEIDAARARARAAGELPAVVAALEDPMIMASVDHLPFMLHGVDASVMVEQRFPLSGVLGHRRRAAEAEAGRLRAESERVVQDIQLDAAGAFLMLRERREMARVLEGQVVLARQFAAAARARYSAGVGNQPDLLRAEVEVARFEGVIRVIAAEIVAAEAMLNATLGRPAHARVPPLEGTPAVAEPEAWSKVRETTLQRRPELAVGRAEISRSQSEASEMRAMYWPMGMIRTGPAYTMTDSWGWMLTVGVSIPLQRSRLRAGVREAEAMVEMARADLVAMTQMAEGEAATARSQVVAARERLVVLRDDILPLARQAIEPSISAYAAGTLPLASVIDTAQALWSIEAELVAAEYELGLAWVRLDRAQGLFGGGTRR